MHILSVPNRGWNGWYIAAVLLNLLFISSCAIKPSSGSQSETNSSSISGKATKDPFFGVHFDFLWDTYDGSNETATKSQDVADLILLLEELNVGSIRMPVRWEATFQDPTNPGSFEGTLKPWELSKYKAIIDAIPSDIDIVVYLDTPSPLYRRLYETSDPVSVGLEYARYTREIVAALGYRVKHWEIWNEPNNSDFYLSTPYRQDRDAWTAGDFVAHLLIPAYEAIKNQDPSAQVVLGGLVFNGEEGRAGEPWPPYYREPGDPYPFVIPDFLSAVYGAFAFFGYSTESPLFDVCAIHPYTGPSWVEGDPVQQTYSNNGTASVMQSNGDTSTPIWWTEWGFSRHYPADPELGEAAQAIALATTLHRAYDRRNVLKNPLTRTHWFTLRDNPRGAGCRFGLVNSHGNERSQAFFVYKNFIMQKNKHVSVIDDFSYSGTGAEVVNPTVWDNICHSYDGSCNDNAWIDGQSIHIDPGRDSWDKAGIYTKAPVPFADSGPMHLRFRFNTFGFSGASPDQTYARISVGPITSIDGTDDLLANRNGLHMEFRRHSDSRLVLNLKSYDDDSVTQPLISWSDVNNCQNPNWSWMAFVYLTFEKDGKWSLEIRDSNGRVCLNINNTLAGLHNAEFTNLERVGVRLATMRGNSGHGFVKYDDFQLLNKALPRASDIELPSQTHNTPLSLPKKGIAAHRGESSWGEKSTPENTLFAFRKAVDSGVAMIELDVRETADHQLVVLHDTSIDRTTTGTGKISEKKWEDVKDLPANWDREAPVEKVHYRDARIPTLEDALKVIPKNIWLNVQVKDEWNKNLAKKVTQTIIDTGHASHAMIGTTLVDFDTKPYPKIHDSGGTKGALEGAIDRDQRVIHHTYSIKEEVRDYTYSEDSSRSSFEAEIADAKAPCYGKIYRMLQYWRDAPPTQERIQDLKRHGLMSAIHCCTSTGDPAVLAADFEMGIDFIMVNLPDLAVSAMATSPMIAEASIPPTIAIRPFKGIGINLIENGGAETWNGRVVATPSPAGDFEDRVMSGWTDAYRTVTNEVYSPPQPNGPTLGFDENKGYNFFIGGKNVPPEGTKITQLIDIDIDRSIIQSGLVYQMEGRFGGFFGDQDYVWMTATFLDYSGQEIGVSESIGVFEPSEWGGPPIRGMVMKTASGSVPTRTRFIRIDLHFTRGTGSFANGMADDLVFVLN